MVGGGGGGVTIKAGLPIEGGWVKHCFSLMYEFYSNNAIYPESISLAIFFSFLTPFDTRDGYYFESNLSLVLLIIVFLIKKTCNVVL